jgi:hypothetical protein
MDDGIVIIVVHVDDLTIAASNVDLMTAVKSRFSSALKMTDLGEVHWLLGIEVHRDREALTLGLSQKSYIVSILKRFGFEDCKPLSMPMDPNVRLTSSQSPTTTMEIADMRHIPYREAVGALMYVSIGTRPDIAYAVSSVSRFSANPGRPHWNAVKRIFQYLQGTKGHWLTYGGENHGLIGYSDTDGSMHEDRHAVSGYAFLIDGGAVAWSSKRQEIIALSTTEAEYVAITHASKEALWLRSFLKEVFAPLPGPTTLFSDNQSAITLTKVHRFHARTKHIDVRFHFIRWIIEDGHIILAYCPTEDMAADTLTKALPSPKAKHFAAQLGLRTA